MKKFMKSIIRQTKEFIEPDNQEKGTSKVVPLNQFIPLIYKAQRERLAIHVITKTGSYTGEVMRYDAKREQLFMNVFQKSVTQLISLSEIKRITVVPDSVKTTQNLG
jgi:hypothetical protein